MKHQWSYFDNWRNSLMSTLDFIKLFSLPMCMHVIFCFCCCCCLFVWSSPNVVLPGALSHPVPSSIRHSHQISYSLLPPLFLHPVHWLCSHPTLYREGRLTMALSSGKWQWPSASNLNCTPTPICLSSVVRKCNHVANWTWIMTSLPWGSQREEQ